jgi:hypothetical protein
VIQLPVATGRIADAVAPEEQEREQGRDQGAIIVGIVLYPGFDLLDVAGMNEVWTFVDASLVGGPVKVITVRS